MMAITDWPRNERPREKLLNLGSDALSDAELLAIFLRTGVRGKTAVDLARDLLQAFGGLRALLSAPKTEFCHAHGLGIAKYVQLQAVLEIARRYLYENISHGEGINDSDKTKEYLKARLSKHSQEVFACLFLDINYRTLACEELFFGTLSHAVIYPREVVKRCLHHHASAVILAHNHPLGSAEPSQADKQITDDLKKVLSLVDITVLDHIVIGANEVVSLAERGMIKEINE